MKEWIKKHWVCLLMIILVVCVSFCLLSSAVYGEVSFIKSIRSQFMKDVIVPLGSATIAFGGLTISIIVTRNQNEKNAEEQRKLQANKIVGESRLQWIKEVRHVLGDYASAHESVLFELSKFAASPENDIFETVAPLVDKLNSKEAHLLSFFNPRKNNERDRRIRVLFSKSRPKIYKLSSEILASKNEMTNSEWKETYEECQNNNYDILDEIRNYLKDEWEVVKKDLDYRKAD